jgi:hypothetical protein
MCRCTPSTGCDGTSSTSRAVADGAAGAGAADETSGIAPGLNGTSPGTGSTARPGAAWPELTFVAGVASGRSRQWHDVSQAPVGGIDDRADHAGRLE